jgi:hypothetical protein
MVSHGKPASLVLADVHRRLAIGWDARDFSRLAEELTPYLAWVRRFLASGDELPSHIPGSGAIAVPVGESKTPAELFEVLGPGARFGCHEHDDYWVTVHYPNPEPVVTLIPKQSPGVPPSVEELCHRCGEVLDTRVGGAGGMFLAWLLPGFSWAMHTDHDNLYEQIAARVHVPVLTNEDSVYVWGEKDAAGERWLVTHHLEAAAAHYVRVDVPHTVVNRHASAPRLHLIVDVHE